MRQDNFDVIIAGAGLVGSTLACALAQGGLRTALLEERAYQESAPPESGFDPRVFALSRASERIFQSYGLWPAIAAQRHGVFREMRVWDRGEGIHFDSAALGEAALGYIVESWVLYHALQQRLSGFDKVQRLDGRRLEGLLFEDTHVSAQLDDGGTLKAKLLVGADGGNSRARELAGIHCPSCDYGHHALVATVHSEQSHAETAWQHFLPDGPLAFLPLSETHSSSIVWSLPPERAADLLHLEEKHFNQQLSEAFEFRLGAAYLAGPRAVFPLRKRHAQRYIKHRLALVGDAAHTIHPLAGQGVNLGLLDAASLAEILLQTQAKKRDIGGESALRRYERWRRGENQAVLWLMDAFKNLFGSRIPGAALLRSGGLGLTHHAGPLKHLIMRRAMGLDGDLPEAARN